MALNKVNKTDKKKRIMKQKELMLIQNDKFEAFLTRENLIRRMAGKDPMKPQEREYWAKQYPFARKTNDNPIAAS